MAGLAKGIHVASLHECGLYEPASFPPGRFARRQVTMAGITIGVARVTAEAEAHPTNATLVEV